MESTIHSLMVSANVIVYNHVIRYGINQLLLGFVKRTVKLTKLKRKFKWETDRLGCRGHDMRTVLWESQQRKQS